MRLSNRQKAALHRAAQAAGYDDARYRLALQNLAGVRSSLDPRLSRAGFIRVMSFFEGEAKGVLPGFKAGYWRDQDRGVDPAASLRVACLRAAAALGWTGEDLDRFLASPRCSNGRCRAVADAPSYWLSRALDALRAIAKRDARVGRDPQGSATPAAAGA